jgi:hypothetical protein
MAKYRLRVEALPALSPLPLQSHTDRYSGPQAPARADLGDAGRMGKNSLSARKRNFMWYSYDI